MTTWNSKLENFKFNIFNPFFYYFLFTWVLPIYFVRFQYLTNKNKMKWNKDKITTELIQTSLLGLNSSLKILLKLLVPIYI